MFKVEGQVQDLFSVINNCSMIDSNTNVGEKKWFPVKHLKMISFMHMRHACCHSKTNNVSHINETHGRPIFEA